MQSYEGTPCSECGEPLAQYGDDAGAFDLECPNGHTLFVPAEASARSRIEALRSIVRTGMAARVDGCIVDVFTAGMLCTVYDALSRENREKFGKPDLVRLVDFGWSHVKVGA